MVLLIYTDNSVTSLYSFTRRSILYNISTCKQSMTYFTCTGKRAEIIWKPSITSAAEINLL